MVDPALLTGLVLATRIPFRSHYLYDIDSVNFALGMRRFYPTAHQPHPPGYFLYIWAARAAAAVFQDANTALIAIAVAASCAAAVLIYALAYSWSGRAAAVLAGLMFVFSPLAWFHGTVALTYAVEAFFSALTGYFCWLTCDRRPAVIVPAAVVVAIATGFRPSSFLFLLPLLLLAAARTRRYLAAGAAALTISLALWIVPMAMQAGGAGAWWSSLHSLWVAVPAKQTVFNSSPATSAARFFSLVAILLLCFGSSAFFVFRKGPVESPRRSFIFVWTAPALAFFTFIFLKFVNSGYLLVVSPPFFALLGANAADWYRSTRFSAQAKIALLSGAAVVNSAIFLFAPVYSSWRAVHRFESELREVLTSLPRIASPEDTLIVGFDSHFLGYRHAGYYLPAWFTVEYPAVHLDSGTRVFAMDHGDTRLLVKPPADRFRKFVFFPLPSGDSEYRDYFDRVRARFPPGALTSMSISGQEFVLGKAADLCFLFSADNQ